VTQVTKAAKLLKNKNIKIIVASPKLRTKQTAAIINKELNVPIIYFDGLIEAKRGKNKKIWENGGEIAGAENLYLFQKRIHDTIKEIINKYDDVLIVGHGIYFRNFMLLLNDEDINPKNADVFYLEANQEIGQAKLYKITKLLSK
jgi:broad specificity phosphatase PhoE